MLYVPLATCSQDALTFPELSVNVYREFYNAEMLAHGLRSLFPSFS